MTVSDAGGGAAALALKTHEQRQDCSSQPNADREAPGADGNVRYSERLLCYCRDHGNASPEFPGDSPVALNSREPI